jgi:hypothetical protein
MVLTLKHGGDGTTWRWLSEGPAHAQVGGLRERGSTQSTGESSALRSALGAAQPRTGQQQGISGCQGKAQFPHP